MCLSQSVDSVPDGAERTVFKNKATISQRMEVYVLQLQRGCVLLVAFNL